MSRHARIGVGIGVVLVLGFICYQVMGSHWQATRLSDATDGDYRQEEVGFGFAGAPSMGTAMVTKDMALRQANSVAPAPATAPGEAGSPSARLIIKTGSLSIVVKDVHAAVAAVAQYATGKGGFVVSSNVSKELIAPTATVVVRIPAKDFDAGVEETKKLGDVKNEQVNGQDVTEEFTDLDSQLRNLRAAETQLLELMKRSGSVSDILAVQQQLTYIRGQIEQLQGRMKYLQQSSDLSTLTVYLSTDPETLPVVSERDQWKPIAVIKDALRSLVEFGKALVNVIIWFVIFIPVWAVIGLVIWGMVKFFRRKGWLQ